MALAGGLPFPPFSKEKLILFSPALDSREIASPTHEHMTKAQVENVLTDPDISVALTHAQGGTRKLSVGGLSIDTVTSAHGFKRTLKNMKKKSEGKS